MKILLVEDERRLALSLKKGLEEERYVVEVAETGTDAVDEAVDGSYDVIVLDVLLPEMDGMTVARTLRAKNISTPILMLTAKSQTYDKIAGLDAGADDYLTKPFSFEELLARLRALLRRPTQTASTKLIVDDLEIDPQKFTVQRQGKMIRLSSKEFALLEFLARHAHQVVTKQKIIDHVWDYEADILPNTVEVYIRNLRKKIDHPFSHNDALISTERGFGYQLGK